MHAGWKRGGHRVSPDYKITTKKFVDEVWVLSKLGRSHVVMSMVLHSPVFVLSRRDLPLEKLDLFELMQRLDDDWRLVVVHDTQKFLKAKKKPFKNGEEKVWYLARWQVEKVDRFYLMALLKAEDHKQEVKHFSPTLYYKQICDPNFKSKRRAHKCLMLEPGQQQ